MDLAETAQTLPDPTSFPSIGWLLLGLGALFMIFNQGADLIGRFREKKASKQEIHPQPLIVQEAVEYATKEELNEVRRHIIRVEASINDQFKTLREERRTSVAQLHNRIEATTAAIRKEVKEDNAGLHDRLTLLLANFQELKGACHACQLAKQGGFGK